MVHGLAIMTEVAHRPSSPASESARHLVDGKGAAVVATADTYLLGVARRRPARTLLEASFDAHVLRAAEVYGRRISSRAGCLIGTLALNFYTKPRFTCQADFLVLPDGWMARGKSRAAQSELRQQTGAEINPVTPDSIDLPMTVAERIVATAVEQDGVPIASPEGLVALKLGGAHIGRRHHNDLADVVSILAWSNVDMAGWELTTQQQTWFDQCVARARG